jgi:hypothetical protein
MSKEVVFILKRLMIGLCKLKQKGSLGLALVRVTVATSYKDFEDMSFAERMQP